MHKQTKSILDELTNISFKKDKENVVESRASHILESAIRLMHYIREFSKGIARVKENQEVRQNLKTVDGEYQED